MLSNSKRFSMIITLIFTCGLILVLMTACSPETATTSLSNQPQPTASFSFKAAKGSTPLFLRINASSNIVVAQVTDIKPLVWTTPDGLEPVHYVDHNKYGYIPEQVAPVEIAIKSSFKGNLTPDTKLLLLVAGAPGSKPFGNSWNFPKVGDTRLWFLSEEYDYRFGKGVTPLIAPNLGGVFQPTTDGRWVNSGIDNDFIELSQLQQLIANPGPDVEATIRSTSSAVSKFKPGQAINLVQLYGLRKTDSIVLKGGPNPKRINDIKQIQATLLTIDQAQTISSDVSLPNAAERDNILNLIFVLQDGSSQGFIYNFKANYVVVQSPDMFKIAVPSELRQALGLP